MGRTRIFPLVILGVTLIIFTSISEEAKWIPGRDVVQPIMLDEENDLEKDSLQSDQPSFNYHNKEKLVLELQAFNKRVVLDLKKNGDHFASNVRLRTFDKDDNLVISQYSSDCYYHGVVRDSPDSTAALSTCGGLRGSYQDESGDYNIAPLNDDEPEGDHEIIRSDPNDPTLPFNMIKNEKESLLQQGATLIREPREELNPENDAEESRWEKKLQDAKYKEELESLKVSDSEDEIEQLDLVSEMDNKEANEIPFDKMSLKRLGNRIENVQQQYRKYPHVNNSRYLEFFAIVDHGTYLALKNDTALVLERLFAMMNQVDRQYSQINVRIVMVGVEVWTTKERFPRTKKSAGIELGHTGTYFHKNIKGTQSIDVLHFMSHIHWGVVVGLAWVNAACGSNPTAINLFTPMKTTGTHGVVSHELAHNLNMGHDGKTCKCLNKNGGCVMGAGGNCRLCGFSDCCMNSFTQKSFTCLSDYPTKTFKPVCGNGIIDLGEECDCGTPENCRKKDPCCMPYMCRLKIGSQCSDFKHPKCCSKCMFKPQGVLCRDSTGPCDLPEYCTGQAATCPKSSYTKDGVPCNSKLVPLRAHWRVRQVSFERLNPPVETRYIKIVQRLPLPHFKHYCIRTEVLGCDLKQSLGSKPTPISTRDLFHEPSMCLAPANELCNKQQSALIIYKREKNSDCYKDNLLFILSSDGTFRHSCSNKLICPTSDGHLQIASSCTKEDSIFIRTPAGLLIHNKTRKCVVGKRNRPKTGENVMLSNSCHKTENNILDFQVPDCLIPQGLENKKLPNSALTSFSYYTGKDGWKHNASAARLWLQKGYCSKSINDKEYLQIDLGMKKKVTVVKVQSGTYSLYFYFSNDGQHWRGYHGGGNNASSSTCYRGQCVNDLGDQCRLIWDKDASKADDVCWKKMNKEANGYGTCSPNKNVSCNESDIKCGQLQCLSPHRLTPLMINYGTNYQRIEVHGKKCSIGSITFKPSDRIGNGMVQPGTKCGDGKVCYNYKCVEAKKAYNVSCPIYNGQECGGIKRGVCLNTGKCYCYEGYDPSTGCAKLFIPRDGGFGSWSRWTECSKQCGGGSRKRYRFCESPYPAHGGKDCTGKREEDNGCNMTPCPVVRSCKELMKLKTSQGLPFTSGVYSIKPADVIIKTFCDMKTSGGGWTLILARKTNTWTSKTLLVRNPNNPNIFEDFSILKYADSIKDAYFIAGNTFEYRLDAQNFGKFGGVWKSPRSYSFTSNSSANSNIKLVEKYGTWNYGWGSFRKRMPFLFKSSLSTSNNPDKDYYGTVAASYAAQWLYGNMRELFPEHVWYWLREGDVLYPKSCKELLLRSSTGIPYPTGSYKLSLDGIGTVNSICDMDRFGGGWTLALTRATKKGWNRKNVGKRNIDTPSKDKDFSIYEYTNKMKSLEIYDQSFQYIIEADGDTKDGGVFSSSSATSFLSCSQDKSKPILLQKFGAWNETTSNLAKRIPHITEKNGIYLTTSSVSTSDVQGSLVYTTGSPGTYLPGIKTDPSIVRIWIREGCHRKSCNDHKIHRQQKGIKKIPDGIYLIHDKGPWIVPVYCDMTSNVSGWTLLVTSRHNGWTAAQVLSRNERQPSLSNDYSILRLADQIKSLSNNKNLLYKIEARERNNFGGVFQTSTESTFLAKNNSQTSVKLIQMYGNWGYTWGKLQARVPWLGDPKHKAALLTTAYRDNSYYWGSIVTSNNHYNPAPYLVNVLNNPGIIWYWINEDDCGPERKPVDGKYNTWSSWSPCSVLCGKGKRHRVRLCNMPIPKCGGKPCDPKLETKQTEECTGLCPTSPIRSGHDRFCLLPQSGKCNVTDGTLVVWREGYSKCNLTEAQFVFHADTGTIRHKCSGKGVCFFGGVGFRKSIVISSKCPKVMPKSAHFQRTYYKSIDVSGFCIHSAGKIYDGTINNLWTGCFFAPRLIFDFIHLALGPVKMEIFSDLKGTKDYMGKLTTDSRYPNAPSAKGYIDNFDIPPNVGSNYGARLQTFLVAPMTGVYTFFVSCDDYCTLSLSNDTNTRNAKQIIKSKSYVRRYQWNKHASQASKDIFLTKGKYYYMLGEYVEINGDDHFSVAMKLPSKELVGPITSHYLVAKTSQVPTR